MNDLFNIFRIDAEMAKEMSGNKELQKHDFEELLIAKQGILKHFVNFREYTVKAPFLSFITRAKVHKVTADNAGNCDIWVLRFPCEFIPDTIFRFHFLYEDSATLFPDRNILKQLYILCEMLYEEKSKNSPDYPVIKSLLNAVMAIVESRRKKIQDDLDDKDMQVVTIINFLNVLKENFKRPVGEDYYAEKLFMPASSLNLICKNILQLSASEIIHSRKLIEAKSLLRNTDKSVLEISTVLGYTKKEDFINYFKEKTGLNPVEFREEMPSLIS